MQPDGLEKYKCVSCGGRLIGLRWIQQHLNTTTHKEMEATFIIANKKWELGTAISRGGSEVATRSLSLYDSVDLGQSSSVQEDTRLSLNEVDGLDITNSNWTGIVQNYCPIHNQIGNSQEYSVPPLDLNDITGMGFGGSDKSSDDGSERGMKLNWNDWLMDDPLSSVFQSLISDNMNLPGNEDVPEIEHDLEPSSQWYPFPEKMVCV
jgi:hypothetical protein